MASCLSSSQIQRISPVKTDGRGTCLCVPSPATAYHVIVISVDVVLYDKVRDGLSKVKSEKQTCLKIRGCGGRGIAG